ncbi:MAG: phosphate ABC transporter permease PstA [Chloroflexi bacterium]|nr:phosphate ABC transporter permease PstA [Chloroflexota bacterium]
MRRKLFDQAMFGAVVLCAALGVAILAVILLDVALKGAPALNVAFFTDRPLPLGEEGGGVAPAIIGTLMMLGVAAVIGVPIGVGTAIYLAEYGRGRLASAVSYTIDLLAGVPSVVVGVFVWAVFVRNVFGSFNGLAGGIALALIMIPIITRTVEEMLRLVPDTYREAALGLGVSRAKTILCVVIPTARGGIVTGIILAVARAGGETAPLVLTALGNQFFNFDLMQPMAALPLQIYSYATSPYADWHTKAWGSALVLILVIGLLSLSTRLATRKRAGF